MKLRLHWNCGLLFGIIQDELLALDEESGNGYLESVIQVHLGVFAVIISFE